MVLSLCESCQKRLISYETRQEFPLSRIFVNSVRQVKSDYLQLFKDRDNWATLNTITTSNEGIVKKGRFFYNIGIFFEFLKIFFKMWMIFFSKEIHLLFGEAGLFFQGIVYFQAI